MGTLLPVRDEFTIDTPTQFEEYSMSRCQKMAEKFQECTEHYNFWGRTGDRPTLERNFAGDAVFIDLRDVLDGYFNVLRDFQLIPREFSEGILKYTGKDFSAPKWNELGALLTLKASQNVDFDFDRSFAGIYSDYVTRLFEIREDVIAAVRFVLSSEQVFVYGVNDDHDMVIDREFWITAGAYPVLASYVDQGDWQRIEVSTTPPVAAPLEQKKLGRPITPSKREIMMTAKTLLDERNYQKSDLARVLREKFSTLPTGSPSSETVNRWISESPELENHPNLSVRGRKSK